MIMALHLLYLLVFYMKSTVNIFPGINIKSTSMSSNLMLKLSADWVDTLTQSLKTATQTLELDTYIAVLMNKFSPRKGG